MRYTIEDHEYGNLFSSEGNLVPTKWLYLSILNFAILARPETEQAWSPEPLWSQQRFVNRINDSITVERGIRDPRTLAIGTLDTPTVTVLHKPHLISSPPPTVHFSRQGRPDAIPLDDLSQMIEKGFIDIATAEINQIIRMRDETQEAILLMNQADLSLP